MMKNLFVTIVLLIFVLLISSCRKEYPEPELPFHQNVSILLGTKVIDYQLRKIDFILDVAVIRGAKTFDSTCFYAGLPDSCFSFNDYFFNGTEVRHVINHIEFLDTFGSSTFYNCMLLDQSSSGNTYQMRDPYNFRFENYNAFLKNLNYNGNLILAAFARNGKIELSPVTFYGERFSQEWEEKTARILLDLTHKTGGTSSRLDAIYEAVNFMIRHSPDSNRSITVFTINKDDGKSNHTLFDITNLAQNHNVRINSVLYSYNDSLVDIRSMLALSNATGGFSMLGGTWELSSAFFMMNDLLKRNVDFYRIYVTMTIGAPNYFNPTYRTYLKVKFDNNEQNDNYVNFLLEKP